ncbi:MAG: hypothetical protein ACI4TM_06695 [Candidatus Cryptobacteroides sp.]
MKTIEVTEKEVKAAFDAAKTDEMKRVLAALFCKEEEKPKPTLDDYRTIKSYEDACEALGIEPILTTDEDDQRTVVATETQHFLAPKHLVALYKLETISCALWGRNFVPKPQAKWDGKTFYYWPWFVFYTQEEIDKIKANPEDYDIAALFGGGANSGALAGFGCLITYYRPADTGAYIGFRLCQENEEKARYFASTFAELWVEYLAFGFNVTERIF